jgi:uncharacterized protein (DUF488 family)
MSRQTSARGRTSSSPNAFTIGYEGRSLHELLGLLQAAGVERVLDVRALPLSRRRGFSKTPLSTALAAEGIEYVHLRAAGNPYRDLKADITTCLARYAQHLDAHPEVLVEIEAAISGRKTALICVEGDVRCCHRSVIVDRLQVRNPRRKVRHL